jgi:Uma2 family endonuclease
MFIDKKEFQCRVKLRFRSYPALCKVVICEDEKIPCLVCEVLSPSTAHKDKSVKKELYECFGIKNYLIIDPINRYVDSFILKDDKLIYDKCYGEEDKLVVECLDESIEVRDFFE